MLQNMKQCKGRAAAGLSRSGSWSDSGIIGPLGLSALEFLVRRVSHTQQTPFLVQSMFCEQRLSPDNTLFHLAAANPGRAAEQPAGAGEAFLLRDASETFREVIAGLHESGSANRSLQMLAICLRVATVVLNRAKMVGRTRFQGADGSCSWAQPGQTLKSLVRPKASVSTWVQVVCALHLAEYLSSPGILPVSTAAWMVAPKTELTAHLQDSCKHLLVSSPANSHRI